MADFELIRQIPNRCKNNQMRDVSIEEISCDDPVQWVREHVQNLQQLSCQTLPDGSLCIVARTGALMQEFHFTPL